MFVDLEGLTFSDDPCESDRLSLADYAFSLQGDTSFSRASRKCASNLCFPNNSWKCNLFVYHTISHTLGNNKAPRLPGTRYAWTANTWARSSAKDSNWKIVTDPKRGDVAAKPASQGSGHVGIYSFHHLGAAQVMAANRYSVDWSSSHAAYTNKLVYRRYVGCE